MCDGPRRRGGGDRLRLRATTSPHYPRAVTAVAGRRAGRRRVGARGEARPGDERRRCAARASTASRSRSRTTRFDAALSTWTMCTIPDLQAALRELRRVLKPGGELHFVEHGLAPDEKVQRWQHRLNPLQGRIFGGCHLDRPIVDSIREAGFEVRRGRRVLREALAEVPRRELPRRRRLPLIASPPRARRARQPHQPGASRPRRGARARPHRRPHGPPRRSPSTSTCCSRARSRPRRSASSSTCCWSPSPSTG